MHNSASGSGSRPGTCAGTVEQLSSISILSDRNRLQEKEGWDPQVPGPPAKWPADKVVHGGVIVTCWPYDLGRRPCPSRLWGCIPLEALAVTPDATEEGPWRVDWVRLGLNSLGVERGTMKWDDHMWTT